ncbi:MAG: UPF0149 family protein [Cardiobacteriaceae bacterium]|nr:UPF0149 family protein [Cardiobacteriaceae bacterium]
MTTQPRHDALADLITTREWWFTASEAQGILSALTACGRGAEWPQILFAAGEIDDIAQQAFTRLSQQIETSLSADDLIYQLLLPEESPLSARAEALTAWVQGFLVAIRWSQPKLDEDCENFLHDLEEIGKLDYSLEDSEENRRLLNNLEEHCRMGALMIYAYCHRNTAKKIKK